MSLEIDMGTLPHHANVHEILSELIATTTAELVTTAAISSAAHSPLKLSRSMELEQQGQELVSRADTQQLYGFQLSVMHEAGLNRITGLTVEHWDRLDEHGYVFPDAIRAS